MKRYTRHLQLHRIQIALFSVFAGLLFLFIRFYSSYPSESAMRAYDSGPTRPPLQPNILPTGEPVTETVPVPRTIPLATFSEPGEALVFDYPADWTASTSGEVLVITDTGANGSAGNRIEVSKQDTLPRCTPTAASCKNLVLNNRPFRIESKTLTNGKIVHRYATIHDGTAYIFTGTFRQNTADTDAIMSEIAESIVFQ